jgi:hypothetical protein
MSKQNGNKDREQSLALFIDFENLALGVHDRKKKFDINLVLERLLEKGNILVKRAYSEAEAARGRGRADRGAAAAHRRQELGRHPHGRGCDGPELQQGAPRRVRHRLG